MVDLTFEPATPDEPEKIGEWLHETASAVFDYIFGGKEAAAQQLAAHWAQPAGLFSHVHATVARQGDTILGVELGFVAHEKEAQTKATTDKLHADYSGVEFAAIAGRAAELDPMFPGMADDAYYLQHLVVAPEARGTGCGRAMLRRAFERAKADGFSAVHLDVLTSNPAQGFYLANGMADTVEIRLPKLVRSHDMPGVIRMVKTF